jgi:TolB-like protein/DNA-binding winged helix-turn-helix (wHTH) protein
MLARETGEGVRTERWRAGDIELDVGQQRVLRGGVPIDLPRLSFEMLLALMRAAPNFLSNEELMHRVWPGLVVSPETVTQRVKLLRDALGDDPKRPACIEGLRARGYRLIPAVSRVEAGEATPAPPPTPRRRWWWAAGAAAAVAASILVVAVWRTPAGPGNDAPVTRTAAILPFVVINATERSRELATGLVNDVQAQLAGVRGLQVIASYSASEVDDTLAPRQIGKVLGARYLVQGSVQESAGRLRVTAKLVDAHADRVEWVNQFERESEDLFGMQDAVAAGVVRALEARIAGLDPTIPPQPRSHDVDAQLAYQRGRKALGRTTVVDSELAAREFALAQRLDPTFAPALIGLYDARMQATSLRRGDMEAAARENAHLLADAERLQPDSGAAQLARAMWGTEPFEIRVRLFEAGLARDPSNVRALTAFSELLDNEDQLEEGGRWLQRALEIDPLWPRAHFRQAQRNFAHAGSAIEKQTQKVLELDPDYYPALQRQAKYLWQLHGEFANAIAVIERAIATDPENPWAPHTAVAFYLDIGEPAAAEALARSDPVVDASTAALRAQYAGNWRAAKPAIHASHRAAVDPLQAAARCESLAAVGIQFPGSPAARASAAGIRCTRGRPHAAGPGHPVD